MAMMARRNPKVASAVVFLSVVGLDQLTKWLVLRKIGLNERVDVVGPLSLVRRYNTGVAFSLGAGSAVTAWLVTAVVVALLVWVVRTISRGAQPLFALLLAVIAGGGVGNQLDRLFRNGGWNKGAVIDFIDAGLFNFAIFNVADMALSVGCALLAAWTLLGAGPDQPAARPAAPSTAPRPVPTTLNESVGSTPSLQATDRGLVSGGAIDEQAAEVSTSANNNPVSPGLPSSASDESSTKGR
jgi:signal peptidase II